MKTFLLDGRASALIIVVGCCLTASSPGILRRVRANPNSVDKQLPQASGSPDPPACTDAALKFNGADTSFRFKCPEDTKLLPAEATNPLQTVEELTHVYEFTPGPTRAEPVCQGPAKELTKLVPQSSLVKNAKAHQAAAQQTNEGFTLTIGPAQPEAKHLCYVCTPNNQIGGAGLQGQKKATACTIYVTVPQKETQKPPEDNSSGSYSSHSVLGWLSVMGCAWGVLLRL